MSSHQRKRPGRAAGSGPARKRSRLLPSSAGGTSQAEPIDLEEGGAPAFEPEVIDLTDESSEAEVITISDDESAVDREQSQQQPYLSSGSENSPEPLARNNEEEPRDIDNDSLLYDFDAPYWSDEDSQQDREQNQQHLYVPKTADNSANLLKRDDEEEPGDVDSSWSAGTASPLTTEDEDSEDWEPPEFSRSTENSEELSATDDEEEPRDVDSSWSAGTASPLTTEDEDSEDWEPPEFSRSTENSEELSATDDEEEPRDVDGLPRRAYPTRFGTHYYPEWWYLRREPHFRAQDNSAMPVMNNEEEQRNNDAQPGVIRCPICMDFYSQIMRRGGQIMSTLCGHVFCSRCLPLLLERTHMCPTCRVELSPELYHPIFI